MKSNGGNKGLSKVYYVESSGFLFPVPAERIAEVGQLKEEFRRREAEAALMVSSVRRA